MEEKWLKWWLLVSSKSQAGGGYIAPPAPFPHLILVRTFLSKVSLASTASATLLYKVNTSTTRTYFLFSVILSGCFFIFLIFYACFLYSVSVVKHLEIVNCLAIWPGVLHSVVYFSIVPLFTLIANLLDESRTLAAPFGSGTKHIFRTSTDNPKFKFYECSHFPSTMNEQLTSKHAN